MDRILNLPTLWLGLVMLAACYALAGATYIVVMRLAAGGRTRDFKAISPGMLPPLAVVFALLVGFLAAQVWSDADRGNTAVNREASALRAAVLLSEEFPGESQARLFELIRQHIGTAVSEEWPAMARRGATLTLVPGSLAEALRLSLSLTPHTAGQTLAQRELVVSLQNALEARRQRIVLSGSSVDGVKWGGAAGAGVAHPAHHRDGAL
jgi:hypothetical protein